MKRLTELKPLLASYSQHLLKLNGFAQDTHQVYQSCLERFFEYIGQTLKSDPLSCSGSDMLKYMETLKATGLSNSRLEHYRCALKSFYAFIKKLGLRDDNPAANLFRIKRKRSEKNQPLEANQVIKLLKAIDTNTYEGQRDELMIAILWVLGLRISELLKLRLRDFKMIDRSEKIALLTIHGKGRKQRALFVVDKLFDHFINYLDHPRTAKEKAALLFPGKNGKQTDDSTILRRFERYKQAAGLTCRINPHVLRHTFATEMYEKGVPATAIRAMLGHGSLDESAIYIHISEHKKQEALSLLTIGGK